MIYRPDIIAILAGLALGLGACGDRAAETTGIERVRQQIAAGDVAAAEITIDHLLSGGTPRSDLAALAGEAALGRGDLVNARAWLEDGQFSDPTAAQGFLLLSRLELQEGDVAAATRALGRARNIAPDHAAVWIDIGRLRYRLGNHAGAVEAADRASSLDPDHLEVLRFRGQLARDSDGMLPAATWFAKARETAPQDESLRLEYAAALLDAGQIHEAVAVLDEKQTDVTGSFYLRAVAAARSSNFVEARELLERSGRERRNTSAARLLSAIIDIELGNLNSAAQTLEKLDQDQPDNPRVRELLAYVLSRNGAHDEVVYRFASGALGAGGSAWLRTLVGRAYEALDDREQAAIYLDLAARPAGALALLAPSENGANSPALASRDEIRRLVLAGDTDAAVQMAERFTRDYPGSGDGAALLGDALLADNRPEEARASYEKAGRIRQSWPLTIRMAATTNREDAAQLIAEFSAANPRNAEAAALAADAYAAAGQWRQAAEHLDRAIGGGMRRVPWVLASRSVASGKLGDEEAKLGWALEAHSLQPTNEAAIAALIDALAPDDPLRRELEAKLRSLTGR